MPRPSAEQSSDALSALSVSLLIREPDLQLEVVAGAAGLDRTVQVARVQRPGLALAGFCAPVQPDRVQVLGYSETAYLRTLDQATLRRRCDALASIGPACLIVARGLEVPQELREAGDKYHVPVLRTPLMTSVFTTRAAKYLDAALAARTNVHGVLVDVFGVGVLLMGKSGVGKSEAALDLVLRGQRLVADDVVHVRFHAPDAVVGTAAEMLKHHMEVRGLGIINIEQLFGAAAVSDAKKIELVIEIVEWNPNDTYDRIGVEDLRYPMLGVEVPLVRVPVRPGRNMTTIIEVAARNQLLKMRGVNAAARFEQRLDQSLQRLSLPTTPPPPTVPTVIMPQRRSGE